MENFNFKMMLNEDYQRTKIDYEDVKYLCSNNQLYKISNGKGYTR